MRDEYSDCIIGVVKENKALLKRNDLDAFYDKVNDEWGNGHIRDFTRFFMQKGINPLVYLKKKIPEWCFDKIDLGENNIVINEGIETIGFDAFYSCASLEEITLPSSLKEIGASVFNNCKNLRKVTFKSIPTLKGPLFKNNPKLSDIYIPKPVSDEDIIMTNWFLNHCFDKSINISKENIHYY